MNKIYNELNIVGIKKIPPVFRSQLNKIDEKSFQQLFRLDVKGDGYCGYYILQIINYFLERKVPTIEEIDNKISELSNREKIDLHYLENLEIGLYLSEFKINVASIIQSDLKNVNKKAQRVYTIQTLNYNSDNQYWIFIFMSQRANHYELLLLGKNITFNVEESKLLFMACGGDYPIDNVNCREHIQYLLPEDLMYL